MANPSVSVVISTFNRSNLLPHAIRSVLAQGFQDFEIVIIDDGSTDETHQAVTSFVDPRIRYFYQSNSGLAAGRNAGIRESRARYVTFLDDDDVFLPNKLALQVSFMATHQDVGWSSGGYVLTDLDGRVLSQWRPWLDYPNLETATWLFACPTGVAAVMVERSWLERIGSFDAVNDVIDDWDAWLRLAHAGCKMAWLEEALFEYRLHTTNMVSSILKIEARRLAMLDKFFGQRDLPEWLVNLKSKAYARAYLESSCRKYAGGFVAEAQEDLARAVSLEPGFLANSGDYILQTLCAEAQRPLNHDAVAVMERALENLPPKVATLPRIKQRARAKLAMSRFFSAAQRQDWSTMRRVLPKALLNDPKCALNRGVWSLSATAILGPVALGRARALYQRMRSASVKAGVREKSHFE